MKIQALLLSLILICSNLIGSEEHAHSHGGSKKQNCSKHQLPRVSSDSALDKPGNLQRHDSHTHLLVNPSPASWGQTLRSPYHFFNYTWTGFLVQTVVITRLTQIIAIEGFSAIPGVSWLKSAFLGHAPKRSHDHELNAALQVTLLEHAETQAKLWNAKVTEIKEEEAVLLEKLKNISAGSAQHTNLTQELEKLRIIADSSKQSRDKATKQHQELFDDALQNRSKLLRSSQSNASIAALPTAQLQAKKVVQQPHQHQHSAACGHGHAHGGHAH